MSVSLTDTSSPLPWGLLAVSLQYAVGGDGTWSSRTPAKFREDSQPVEAMARLFWFTVEFGLIRTAAGLRIYGSGIVSSKGESIYCLESASPNRIGFDLMRIMRTQYRIDSFQKTYFVIDSFEQLFEATSPDFTPYYAALRGLPDIPAGDILASDVVLQRGDRVGWAETPDS